MPEAWNRLCYTILWKGQRLAVTVTKDAIEIVNETAAEPVEVEIWGKRYSFIDKIRTDIRECKISLLFMVCACEQ